MNRNIINCLLLITFMVFTGVVRGQSASCSDYINAFPWTYGFEDATSGSQSTPNASFGATCWTHHNDASAPDAVGYPYIIAYTPHSGSKALYWSRSNAESYGTYQIVVLPGVDPAAASVSTLELSFWVKPSNASYEVTFVVGVMTDPTDVSTFVAVGDPIQVTGSDWSEVGVSLSSYSGTGQYVAIRADSAPSLYWSASVDDFTLSQIESCPAVKGLRMTACGTDEITVAWTPKGTASSWKVSIDGVVSGIATSPTYTFSNLTANTTHKVSVVSQCGGEESAAATLQVSTIAEPITTLPYSCDFEGAAAIVMVNGEQPNQWMTGIGPNTTTGGENSLFIHSTDATNTYDAGSSSTVFAYIPFELPAGSYIIEYDWRSYGDYRDFMRVAMVPATTLLEAGNATGWSQTSIPGIAVDGGSGLCYQQDWRHIAKSFNIPADGIYKLVFFWTNNDASGYPPPAAIDNISLRVCTCPFDASVYTLNVEQTSVSLEWSGYDADYRLEYGPSGFQPGSGTVMNVTGTTATLNGLTATTEYDVYISLVCTENDASLPIHHTFATLTGPVSSFPWQCDFEGYSTEGWGMEDDGGSNHWTTGYTVYNSPDHGLFVSNDSYSSWDYDNSSASSVYAWRELQLEAASYEIGFQWQAIGEGGGGSAPDDYLTVRLVPEAEWGTSGGMVIFGPADNMAFWDNASIPVTITNAGNYRLVFEWHNDDDGTGYGSAAIDDIEIVKVGSTSPTDPGTAFPWTCDFEGASDSEGWTMATGGDNAWYMGTAVNNGGSNALYVSNDGGVNNAYTTSSISVSYAYRVFDFAAAEYQLSFDWLCFGEGTYDFLRVALAPEGTSLPDDPNQWPSSGDLSGFTFIDGGNCLSQSTSWATQTTTFTVPTAGRYRVIFVWRNDDSYGTQPPAAIDNIELSRTCSVPTSLTVNNLSTTSGSLQWTGTAPSYVVKYGPVTSYDYWHSDYDAYTAYTVDGTALDLTGLVSGTEYIVGIRSICAVGDTGDFATFTFTTPAAITPMSVPYSCDFESSNTEWLLDNGSYTNQWHIGTAANNTVGGNNALYVSDDAGLTNHYSDNSARLYAVTALALEAGTYTIDYDWRCYAGSDDDFIVRLVSTTYDYTYNFSYIHLDDGNLRYSSDWMHAHNMFTITDAGTYYLVIYWSNSTSIGSQPPAAIDNIYVAPVASHIPPYTCSFETSNEESDWYITNDSPNSANRWTVGTAAGSVGSGTRAIYISNNGGTSYAATSNYRDNMYAVTLLSLQAGEYNLSFDWKGVGHENSEFLKVVLTPAALGWNSSQGIATDALFGATDWQTYSQVVTITQPGDYFLALNWKHSSTDYGPPAAIDNLSFVPNTCPAPTNLAATYSDGTLQLTWTPGGTENSWRVNDGSADHHVTTPTFAIPNALPAHSYHFTVQALCGTAEVGTPATLDYRTNYYCADMNLFYASDQTLSTAANATMPVSNTSNYSLTQTIFEASELPDPNYLHAIAFYYEPAMDNNMMTSKNDVDIYFMPTDKTAFSSTTDYVNLSSDAVLVYSGPLNCSPGWNYFEFTTPYLYVGGNLMMIVDDNSGTRDSDIGGYNYTFRVRACDGNKTLVNTSTSSYNRNIDPHNITGAGGLSIYPYRPEMRLISCGNVNTALYHITLQQEGPGSISVTGSDIVPADYVFAGTELTITATPAQDYLTASFTVNGVDVTSPYTFTVSSDLDIQAVFLPAAPDLHVTSLTYTPLVNGQEATITWTVRNDGAVPTPAGVSWNDYLYIKMGNEAEIIAGNSNVITLGQYPNLSELGVGESYTQQATITIPSDLASSCYLVVVTNERDARDIQCPEGASPAENSSAPFCTAYSQYSPSFTEATHILNPNRHDNFLAKSVTIEDIPRPDLHVVGLSYPAELTTYTSVDVSWTVRNDGTIATPSSWTDRLYLSSEPYIDNTNASSVVTLWSGSNLNALGVGESYTRTISITPPVKLATGEYYIIATADAALVANVSCPEGTDVTTLSGVAPYCTALTRAKDLVEPNRTSTVEGYVQHDNFIIRTVHVNQQLPDLHVANLSIPAELTTYTPVNISWTVRNDGTAATPSSWIDCIYLSSEPYIDNTNASSVVTLWSGSNRRSLNAGENYTRTVSVTLPGNLATGDYYIIATADAAQVANVSCPDGTNVTTQSGVAPYCTARTPTKQLVEPNRASPVVGFVQHDNFIIRAVHVDQQLPDLHVADLTIPTELTTYTPVDVTWTVRNDGTAVTPSSWTDCIYLSSEPYIDNTNASSVVTLWSGNNIKPLAVGESYTRTVSVTIPGNLTTGDYYIIATADAALVTNVSCPDGTNVTTQSGVAPYCTALTPYKLFVEPNSTSPVEGFVQHDNFIIRAVHVDQQLPDLHVANLTIPTELTTYTSVNVSWTVRNDGTITTPTSWTDRIYLSSEPYIDNTNASSVVTLWSGNNRNALGVGESYTRTVSVTLPGNLATGDYYIIATADAALVANVSCPDGTNVTTQSGVAPYCTALTPDKYLVEPNRTSSVEGYVQHDNFIIRTVHVDQQLPDLHVANLSIPAELTSYTSFLVRWTVRNDGTAATPTSWADCIFLSSEPYIDNANASSVVTLWSGYNLNALGVGESYTRTVSVTLPGNLATGDYYIIATADAAQVANVSCPDGTNATTLTGVAPYCTALTRTKNLVEPNRTSSVEGYVQHDNFIIRTVHVDQQMPDLHVADLSIPSELTTYMPVDISWTVRNDGTAATLSSWTDRLYLSSEPYIDNTNASNVVTLWSGDNLNALGVSESYTRTVSVTIPGNLTTGDYYIIATADAAQVANVSCPDGTNATTLTGVVPYCTALTRTKNLVEPNRTSSVEGYVQHDNFIIRIVHVDQQLPDLHVANITFPEELTTYMPVNISWTVRNDGTAATHTSWTDRLYLSSDPYIDNSNASSVVTLWSGDNLNALGVGESYTRTVSVTLPGDLATGDYYIIATADAAQVAYVTCPDGTNVTTQSGVAPYCIARTPEKQFVEPNSTSPVVGFVQHDNFIIRGVHVDQQLPDLHVANLTFPEELTTYMPVDVSWTVRNDGTAATPTSWTDHLYLSSEPYIDNSNASSVVTLWSGNRLNDLDAGESYTRNVSVTIPGNLATGDYYIIATADAALVANVSCPDGTNVTTQSGVAPYCTARTPTKQFVEPNSTFSVGGNVQHDNFIIRGVHVDQQLPDLSVSAVSHSDLCVGYNSTITFTVSNSGATTTPQNISWTDKIFLSTTPELTNSSTLLGSYTNLRPLMAGDSYTRSVNVTISQPGNYYLIVSTDYNNDVWEPDEVGTDNRYNLYVEAVNVSTTPLAQLHAVDVNCGDIYTGQLANASFTVRNEGLVATSNGVTWTDYLYLSYTPDGRDKLLGSWESVSTLDAGGEYTRDVSFTLPLTYPTGEYYLVLVTNPNADPLLFGDHYDNTISIPVNVVLPPIADLQVTNIYDYPVSVYSGRPLTVRYTISNIGAGPTSSSGWRDLLFISTDPDITDLATLANEAIFLAENRVTRENSLISDSSVNKRFSVQTTQPELYGTYYLYVATNVDEDEYEFTNYGNNITRSTEPMEIMLGFISDLSVYQLEADEEATHDGYLKFKYYVRNSEEKHAWPCWVAEYQIESAIKRSEFYMPRWTDKVFLSSTPDLMGVQINNAGQQVAAGHNQVDIANDEWYYLLNSTPDNYPGIGYAKVHVTSVPCEEPIYPWADINEGDVGKYVYCRMDSNRYVDGGWPNDYLLGQPPSHLGHILHPDAPPSGYLDENLRNGDHYQKKYKSTYPDFLPETGTYYIVVYTDSEHDVMEYGAEGNNKASTPITLNRYYHNFTLSDLSIDRTSLVPGYSVNADLTLHNAGGLNFNDSLDIYVYCSNSFAQDADGYVRTTDPATETPGGPVTRLCYTLKDKYHLKHNTSQDLSLRVPMPDDLPDGTYTLYFVVNPTIHTQGVTRRHESQYGDNVIGSEQINICQSCPMPDLMADNLEIPQNITAGDDITIEFDVHNNGTQSLNGNAVYTAFHVRLAGSDQWQWCPVKQQSEPTPVSHPTTPGGGSEHYVQTVSIPPMLGEGDYICRLTVDANDNVMEAVESDNELVYDQMVHIAAHPLFLAIRVNDVTPSVPSTVHPGEPSTMRAGDPYRIAWIVELDHNRPAFHRIESYEKIDSVGYSETIDWEQVPENQNAWVERVYFSTDDDLSDDDIVLKTVGVSYSKATTVFHNPRFYLSGAENVRIPRDIVGEGYIIIEIDADHQTPDTNRANNIYVKPVTVTEAAPEEEQEEQDDSDDPYDPFNPYSPTNPVNPVNPPTPTEPDLPSDLVITAFNVPASVHQRDVVDIEYTITNIGDHPAKGTWTDKVYDGAQESLADSWLASYLYLAKNSHTFTLAPGASKTMTVQVVFPDSEPGHYPITLWADAGDKVNETDKTNNYMTVYYDLLYAAPCDLTVTDIQNTTDVTIGADLHVEWTLKNVGYNSLTGIINDGVYLSADQTIDNSDYLIGEVSESLTLSGEATRVREGDFSLQGVPSGSYYLIVRTNMPNAFMESDYDNNRLVSTSRVTVSLPTLVIGQEETFTLASNHTTAYRLEVSPSQAGKTLALSMVTDAPTRSNDGLYLSHEEMPTTGHYDFGSNTPYVERQQVVVPVAEAGTYYILVSGATIKNIEQEITLLATILEFGIISVDANTGGNAGSFTTVVTGASFDSVMDFRLVRDGNYYPAQRVKFKDACTNYVTFNLTDMPVGSYDMEAELPGGIVARKANAFEVTEGLPEDLRCRIHAPDAVRTDQNVEINFEYYNAGNNDVEIAGFMIVSGNNHPVRENPFTRTEIMAMNRARDWPDTLIFYIAEQGMELGVIRPGQGGTKRFFTYTNKLYNEDELDIKVYAIGTRKE